jgi:YesN/AraC family two-component response regulator
LQNQAGTSGVLSSVFNKMKIIAIAPVPADMQIHLNHLMEFMRYECDDSSGGTELVLRNAFATVLCIFLVLLEKQESEQSLSDKNGIIYAINYIKANYSENLVPSDVAKIVNMSMKNFIASFKRFSGHSFHDFLNKVRIEKSVEILKAEGDAITLSELVEICGYNNYITFYRNFVKYTGISPLEFQKNK